MNETAGTNPVTLSYELTDDNIIRVVLTQNGERVTWREVVRDGLFIPPAIVDDVVLLILQNLYEGNVASKKAQLDADAQTPANDAANAQH